MLCFHIRSSYLYMLLAKGKISVSASSNIANLHLQFGLSAGNNLNNFHLH